MLRRGLAVALCAVACGEVDQATQKDAGIDAAPPPDSGSPRPYVGTMDEVPPVTFGGAPYCTYKITLKQLQIDIAILPSGQIASGHVQDLNVESVVPSTT